MDLDAKSNTGPFPPTPCFSLRGKVDFLKDVILGQEKGGARERNPTSKATLEEILPENTEGCLQDSNRGVPDVSLVLSHSTFKTLK